MKQHQTYYTPRQLARAWGLREREVKLLFANDPRMEKIEMLPRPHFPGRTYFRIPESAALEIYEQHGQSWEILLTAREKTALAVGFAAGVAAAFERASKSLSA